MLEQVREMQAALKAALEYIDPVKKATRHWTNGDVERLRDRVEQAANLLQL